MDQYLSQQKSNVASSSPTQLRECAMVKQTRGEMVGGWVEGEEERERASLDINMCCTST